MNDETYQLLLYGMSVLAVVVFVSLYFVKAGYGMFRTRSWGWSVPNKVGWVCMEAPAFLVMGIGAWKGGVNLYTPQAVFVALFLLHYFQRSFVFPLLMKGKSRMPLAIMAMGILFNVINATLLAASFSTVPCLENTRQLPTGRILCRGWESSCLPSGWPLIGTPTM